MGVSNCPLVSIISPCFNGEDYIGRMLESILSQSYTNIEMICINDGSTDKTEQKILSYKDRFAEKGMILQCFNQENQGQAAAMNNGLKHVRGKYLSWIDCDDFLMSNSIETKLIALEKNPEYGVCTSDIYLVDESDINKVIKRNGEHFGNLNFQKNQFYLAVVGLSMIESLCQMVRMSCFDKINPQREIHPCREGQNYQMILPLYYYFPRLYINEPLGCYVIRRHSHYHCKRSIQQQIERKRALLSMFEKTLIQMGLTKPEIVKCINMSYFSKFL